MKCKHMLGALLGLAMTLTAPMAAGATENPLPTPENPGGLPALTSPGGLPSSGTGPIKYTFTFASMASKTTPGLNPKGANDFTCRSREGRRPIILVPGTNEDAYATWAWYAPMLTLDGWCVYTFNYNPSTTLSGKVDDAAPFNGDIRQSAAFMAGFVDRVLASTGADKVDLVGHSQGGGPLPRAYIKWYGGDKKVNQLVGIVPSNKGTTVMGLQTMLNEMDTRTDGALMDFALRHNMMALPQQLQGSPFLTELNRDGMTSPGVKYTVIATTMDEVVTPYTNAYIHEPGVNNLLVQDTCRAHPIDHFTATYDKVIYQMVRNALDPRTAKPVNCLRVP